MSASKVQHLPVPVAYSQLELLHSDIVGQDYQVKIRLPEEYANTTDPYPVLYLLDGDHSFAMATDIIQYMIYGKLMPDVIIASPAYGSKKGMHEGGANMRNRDLLPFPFPGIAIPPGGAQFLKFIEKELIPFVEANFRTVAGDRTLWGYSFGGIFALYALFEKPGLFQRYIIVHGFHEKFIEVEETYASRCTDLPARVFLAGPPDEWGNDMQLLADKMKGRNYPGLHLEFEQLSNLDHFAIPAEGLTKGLISVYRKSS